VASAALANLNKDFSFLKKYHAVIFSGWYSAEEKRAIASEFLKLSEKKPAIFFLTVSRNSEKVFLISLLNCKSSVKELTWDQMIEVIASQVRYL
jgi:hypothetical protein